jgi:hypothetical protein
MRTTHAPLAHKYVVFIANLPCLSSEVGGPNDICEVAGCPLRSNESDERVRVDRSVRQTVIQSLRSAAFELERLDFFDSARPGFPQQANNRDMLTCLARGESWQDQMDCGSPPTQDTNEDGDRG